MREPIPAHFKIDAQPFPHPQAVVTVPQARFTILTSRLIRMEYSQKERFEDRPGQFFQFRNQPVPQFRLQQSEEKIEIFTKQLKLVYIPGSGFSKETLSIQILETGKQWRYGDSDPANLMGTARTLDMQTGPVNMEPGLLSRSGWSVVDDSQNPVFTPEGWLTSREDPEAQDLYFFGYGLDYMGCLADFRKVSGGVPLPPRWILGGWWSRFWDYSQDELLGLMDEFSTRQVPLSVCIVDMDWHLQGWTGYTWNREQFPDPEGFIHGLHEKGLRTALNLHPAEGVGAHEEAFEKFCKVLGMDPQSQDCIPFDLEDPRFTRAYFELLHHPQEDMGIDFWWMDWQQGNPCRLPGLDLLWWINHLHFLDSGRNPQKRPLIFSRWGGLGSHRYPIGFSGDVIVSWDSLSFQPHFTAAAANVCYGWWSHDIGGHLHGIEDAELYTRWVQFGVFSPILRLHSTKNPYHQRLPWGHDAETFRITRDAMQLRHALIPYLYSMAWRDHREGECLIRPLYHLYPEIEDAYACPNVYAFGSELLAAPFTSPMDQDTRLSRQVVWLPEGDWFDFFDGRYFSGGWRAIYGCQEDIPVFAKAGAIVPLGNKTGWGGLDNPAELNLYIFPGADNSFDLYEDDGNSQAYTRGVHAITRYQLKFEGSTLKFNILPVEGDSSLVPVIRTYRLVFHSIHEPHNFQAAIDDSPARIEPQYDEAHHTFIIDGLGLEAQQTLQVTLQSTGRDLTYRRDAPEDEARKLLQTFRMGSAGKQAIEQRLDALMGNPTLLSQYQIALTRTQMRALLETMAEAGVERPPNTSRGCVVLWNRHDSPDIRFRLSVEHMMIHQPERRFSMEGGAVPRSRVIYLEDETGQNPALLQVDYLELLKVWLTYAADDYYPRPEDGLY
jgi:alpha-glucosidase (family GH31 glycosyl hydrolase)